MSIQIQGNSGVIAEVDGTTYRALRVTLRPVDYGSMGSYRTSLFSGSMAAGLASFSDVFQARWSTLNYALVWGLQLDGMVAGATGFTAGKVAFLAYVSRSWTVDGSGGTSATLTGNNCKLRTSMATSAMGSMRIASTGALITGTKTNDSQSFAQATSFATTSTWSAILGQVGVYGASSLEGGGNPAPVVLAQNEGISVQATVPATGVWQFGMTMSWTEVASY
jgi:hypothetical protein